MHPLSMNQALRLDTLLVLILCCCLQEEVLLSSAVSLAVTSLLLNLQKGSGQDYAFACFFLISATLLLRVRWFLGAAILAVPVIAVFCTPLWGSELSHVLPHDADLHLAIAWALGALIAYLADDYRRCAAVRADACCHHTHTSAFSTCAPFSLPDVYALWRMPISQGFVNGRCQ